MARQKTRSIWLTCGDENTSFFHKYANHRKNVNSIWKIVDDGGNLVEGFDSLAGAGVNHFETLFQEDKNIHLPDIMKVAENFPTSVIEGENEYLMVPVTLNEI